jgi:CheY-like chemotaxis protein
MIAIITLSAFLSFSFIVYLVVRLRRSEKQRQEAQSLLDIVAHEVRAPLHGIVSYAELLLDEMPLSEARKKVEIIRSCGQALVALVNSILTLSKLEKEQLPLQKTAFSLSELVHQSITLFEPMAHKKKLQIKVEISAALPHVIEGDPHWIRQVVANLLSNAVKFTEHGGIFVGLDCEKHPTHEWMATLTVSDTGAGISKEGLKKIFEPFTQLHRSTAAQTYEGTGLGLAICRLVAKRMGGSMSVESVEGRGTTFKMIFPLRVPAQDSITEEELIPHPRQKAIQPLRVLVADDDILHQNIIRAFFKKIGCDIDLASDGQEAVEKVEKTNYDVVILDCYMPHLSGSDAARLILQQHESKNYRPILVSLSGASLTSQDNTPFDDILQKPVSLDVLRHLITRLDSTRHHPALIKKAS